jgi:hypothetical protein
VISRIGDVELYCHRCWPLLQWCSSALSAAAGGGRVAGAWIRSARVRELSLFAEQFGCVDAGECCRDLGFLR